jgi:lambda family phage tail tape measure protein
MNEWKNLYDDLESAGVDTLKSLSQGFADFVTEGEADFEGLARSAVNSLLQISANAALSGLVSWGQEAASGFFNKTPVTAGVSHSGDIVGSASRTRSVNMEMFSNAPRYHTGGVIGQEVPAILEKGEGVFTAEQMKALGAGQSKQSGTTKVNIINNSGTDVDSEETNTRMDMDGIVMDIVLKKINQPGPYRDNMKRALG